MQRCAVPFADINWLAVLVASVASFVIGWVWFSPKVFFERWWRAMGRDPKDMGSMDGGTPMALMFGLVVVAILVQATVLAAVIELSRAAGNEVGLTGGALIGLLLGAGIAAAASISHRMFAGSSLKVWAIEVGQDTVCLIVMGAVIGVWA